MINCHAARVRQLAKRLKDWAEKRASKNLEHYTLLIAVNHLIHYAYILEHFSEEELDEMIERKISA